MRGNRLVGVTLPLVLLLFAFSAYAQDGDVYWHIDPNVKTCSMVIDPSLTQAQWNEFTREVGGMVSFKSLAAAEPLGTGRFTVGLNYSITPIDQRDPAWINTFTHPDADCPLGDQIKLPTLRAQYGMSSAMDVAGYWSTAPGANYGLVGGELKYAFLRESARRPAAAFSTSFTLLTGVPDFDFGVYSAGFVASKRIDRFAPYVGVRENWANARETTPKVDLAKESLLLTQGFVGVSYAVWKLGLAAEYNVAKVNTFALVIGSRPRVD